MKARVVVVDDSRSAGVVAVNKIKALGFEVDLFECATLDGIVSLFASLEENPPVAVFLDQNMPLMTGGEIATLLKSNPMTQNIKLLMVSGESSLLNQIESIQHGVQGFCVKPISEEFIREHCSEGQE